MGVRVWGTMCAMVEGAWSTVLGLVQEQRGAIVSTLRCYVLSYHHHPQARQSYMATAPPALTPSSYVSAPIPAHES